MNDRKFQIDFDERLVARVVNRSELLYTAGADPKLDKPAHVRSASAIASTSAGFLLFQDDANFIAQLTRHPGAPNSGQAGFKIEAIALPAAQDGHRQFDKGRGNKHLKWDIEAACMFELDGHEYVLAFGSGSTSMRETLVLIEIRAGIVHTCTTHACPALYAQLRANQRFSGSELNLEGAAVLVNAHPLQVRLFQRGNGASSAEQPAIDATVDLPMLELLAYVRGERSAPPNFGMIREYQLPVLGSRLTFTDACSARSAGLLFLCAAEASPNTYDDGPVGGVALGEMHADGSAKLGHILDEAGAPLLLKTEGIVLDPHDHARAFVVVDRDDPSAPSEWLEVVLEGPWAHLHAHESG
jgi:hypothetical protein